MKGGILLLAALAAGGLTACGGGGDDKTTVVTQTVTTPASTPTETTATTPPTETTAATTPATADTGGGDTKPGTTLSLGQSATVTYVPPSYYGKTGHDYKIKLTIESIEKGSIDPDFNNIQLDPPDKKKTPYYVRIKEENLGPKDIKDSDMPTFAIEAIDDRGSEQGDLTILGTFQKCEDKLNPKPFKANSTYSTCQIYLVGGGGSIDEVHWSGSGGDKYSDKPIVWKAG